MSGENPIILEVPMDHRRVWHLDKGVNPVYIGLLTTFAAGVLAWAMSVDRGQATQDAKLDDHAKAIDTLQKNSREDARVVQEKLDRILTELGRRR
jgi:hypothetical protein